MEIDEDGVEIAGYDVPVDADDWRSMQAEIKRLQAERRDRALSELAAHTQAEEAHEARLAAEAEIERLGKRIAQIEAFVAMDNKFARKMANDAVRWKASAEAAEAEIEGLREAMRVMASRADDEIERLRGALQSMDDTIVARFELFVSDQECLFNLRDRIRRALIDKEARG